MKLIFLGTGSPEGMPIALCNCNFCKKGKIRLRPALAINDNSTTLIFDSPPDICHQIINNKIKKIDGIFITHPHFDHLWGIGDLSQLHWVNLDNFSVFVNQSTNSYIKQHIPMMTLKTKIILNNKEIKINNFSVTPFVVDHCKNFITNGFIIKSNNKKVVYVPDIKSIKNKELKLASNADILIIDGQYILKKYIKDKDHLGGKALISLIKSFNAKKIYLIAYCEHWYKKSVLDAKKLLPDNFYFPDDGDVIEL